LSVKTAGFEAQNTAPFVGFEVQNLSLKKNTDFKRYKKKKTTAFLTTSFLQIFKRKCAIFLRLKPISLRTLKCIF